MNHQHGSTPNTAASKATLPYAVRALFVGLALVLSCPAAMAASPTFNNIVIARLAPDGKAIKVATNKDGTYQFTGLAPGNYEITIPGQLPKSVTVGKDGIIKGQVAGRASDNANSVISSMQEVSTTR